MTNAQTEPKLQTQIQTLLPSRAFEYRNGELHCDGVSLSTVAAQLGSPTFVYSVRAIDDVCATVKDALSFTNALVTYAVKANDNLAIIARMATLGLGADIVSGGELARALKAGMPANRIVFSGVGKTDDEIRTAIEAGIRSIHIESDQEFEAVSAVAKSLNKTVSIALRVNPDVDPKTHPYISTGLRTSKFGLDFDTARALLPAILKNPSVKLEGLACHIGSQLFDPAPIEDAVAKVAELALEFRAAGAPIRVLDTGGGWAVNYGNESEHSKEAPKADAYGAAIRRGLERSSALDAGFEILAEIGRFIMADAGMLLTRVVFTKQHGAKRFIIVDASMTNLIRPALYKAYHAILPVTESNPNTWSPADVVGPVCETGDFLALDRPMPDVKRGSLLAIRGAGAYAAVMSSHYNARPRAAETVVEGGNLKLIRERERIEDLWRGEQL